MNTSGSMLEEYNYDPCLSVRSKAKAGGRRRNPTNWSYTGVSLPTYTNRGFTGHEHLDMFSLIHMLSEAKSREQSEAGNGRIYDPEIARFLSPDPVIQDPYSIFSYNRYSYCLNNPLKYTDPSGYHFIRNLIQRIKNWFEGERSNNNNENYEEDQGGGWMPVGSGFTYTPKLTFLGGIPYITGYEINGGIFQDVVVRDNRNNSNTNPNFTYTNRAFTFSDDPQSGGDGSSYWLAKAGAIAVTTSVADGPIPIGEAIGAAVITTAAIHDAVVATNNFLNKQGVQYTLRTYTGDIYKIGQTTRYNFTTNTQWRYSQPQLDSWGVIFVAEFPGNRVEILMVEKMKIWNYIHTYNTLPPGNKVPW